MARDWIHRSAILLVVGLVLAAPSGAPGEPGSEPFEVIVVRGASVSRVTGTPGGEIREELLHGDPHPAKPEPEREPEVGAVEPAPPRTLALHVVPALGPVYPVWVFVHKDAHKRGLERGHGRRNGYRPYLSLRNEVHSNWPARSMPRYGGPVNRLRAHRP